LFKFDSFVNSGKVVIEQAFKALKNCWRILKAFNMLVEKVATVILACCILHNYCELKRQHVPVPTNVRLQNDPHIGFHIGRMQLPCEGLPTKLEGEALRDILFALWIECNSQ